MTGIYPSPLGVILLTGDEIGLTDVRFGEPGFGAERQIPPDLLPAARWLDRYFAGEQPGELPPLHPVGTPFQLQVWEMLREIPYGKTCTYKDMAKRFLRPGHRGCRGEKQAVPVPPLPPGYRLRRQSHRLRLGPLAEGMAFEAGRGKLSAPPNGLKERIPLSGAD